MRVLIAANSDIGLYRFRKELLQALLEMYEVYIALPLGELIPDLEAMGCKYIATEFDRHGTNPMRELHLISLYNKIIREVKPGIVLTYTIKPNIYGGFACKKLKIPYIANITGLGTAIENGGIMQKVAINLYRRALKNAQKVFFQNTENIAIFKENKIALGKHVLLPGSGVNLKAFTILEYPPDHTIEFAFISRIMKEKGIDQYLEAAICINRQYPFTRFHVCGFCEQEYGDRLNELDKLGIIIYHGMVGDIRTIMRISHCTVLPSYHEGTSNILLESAAMGRPIIATRVPGCRETFEEGVTGFGCEVRDTQDLVRAIEGFIALPHEEKAAMGIAGRRKMEKEYNRQIIVDAYMQEINGSTR